MSGCGSSTGRARADNRGMNRPGVVIILPCGLTVGGVTSWAVRLVNGLCHERPSGLVLHRAAPGATELRSRLDSAVRVFDLREIASVEDANGDIAWLARAYGEVVSKMGGRVVMIPTLLGDCVGACAALTQDESLDVRVVGSAHSENGYDTRVLEHYQEATSAALGVSARLTNDLRKKWNGREADVVYIPTGVESGGTRVPASGSRTIVYTGRLDEGVKRVSALVHMSDSLAARGEPHELVIVGDGPAGCTINEMIAARERDSSRRIVRIASTGPEEVRTILRRSEFFVLPSRFEGLSVSMLEAMSEGCCCVVTAENSGASEAIEHGVNGMLLETESGAPAERAGEDLARVIVSTSREQAAHMGRRAREVVESRFSLEKQVRAVSELIERVAAGAPRRWPREREAAFTAKPGAVGSGTVPRDADVRLRLVMDSLRGRKVGVHGTGRHSVELAHVLGEYAAEIRAFVDDDPARQGVEFLGKPVVASGVLAKIGATDVVISSHLHQEAIWSKRDEYERVGVRVHRLYA